MKFIGTFLFFVFLVITLQQAILVQGCIPNRDKCQLMEVLATVALVSTTSWMVFWLLQKSIGLPDATSTAPSINFPIIMFKY